ncbi:hypothetical protein A4X13_0g9365 [Tilletia indica]|uniref:Uncharacterized protein n=1 Tax=Tilletia indica TaxID=43049 RepID=A0A8T8SA23_9BASI|nr:hypothetical protein A4X13_0g9365 [Tilletia indica]
MDAMDHYTQETKLQARAIEGLKGARIPVRVVAAIGVTGLVVGAGLGYDLCLALHHSHNNARRSVPLGRGVEAAPLVTVDTDARAKLKDRSPLSTPTKTMMIDVKTRDRVSSIAKVLLAVPVAGCAIGLGYYLGVKLHKPHRHDDHTPQGP